MSLTSDTEWTLRKTGSVNPVTQTVTWTITATQGPTTTGQLILNGTMTVTNKGTAPATIGNIVVNLQTKAGPSWVTRSSDIADATSDDAATSAHVVQSASSENRSFFTENGASGSLLFMDASTNTVFSLVPQKTIAPGETETLLFTATFDNNVLNLATGTPFRTEIIVSFGNAATSAATAPNIDINGNGIIDADEHRVRSVPTRFGLVIPPQTPGNRVVVLTDTIDDITTTGTVTFSNATFNLGATGGTVTVRYDGGTNGGTITNCAHLTSPGSTANSGGFVFPTVVGIDLTACDTQTIGGHTCIPGTPDCGWEDGDLTTYPQAFWSDDPTASSLLLNNYIAVYPGGIVEVGIAGAAGFSMLFTGVLEVLAYLPAVGPAGALNSDLVDPTSSSAGGFGGEVLALQLNVDFSDQGVLPHDAAVRFGDLTLCGLSSPVGLNTLTVRQVLAIANTLLGGGTSSFTIAEIDPILRELNASFGSGSVSTFAQDHLINGSCP